MNLKQKNQLKNQLKSKVSNYDLSIEDIEKVDTDNRKKVAHDKVLEIKIVALDWALEKNVVQKNELTTDKYFVNDYKLSELITSSGLLVAGGAGSAIAVGATTAAMAGTGLAGSLGAGFLGTAAANVGLGTLATTGVAAGAATVAVAIAPVALACAGIYAIIRYRKNKELVHAIKNEFEEEKLKVLNFYLSKINTMKEIIVVDQEKVIMNEEKKSFPKKEKKKVNQKTTEKATPSPKETLEKDIKPIIKKIEKDIYYDKCVVRYDTKLNACTIKHEDTTWDKKDGLNHKTFKDSIDKLLVIIGDEIFNWEDIEIIFIGTEAHFIELKKKVKVFEKDNKNKIDKAIIIIAKKEKSSNE